MSVPLALSRSGKSGIFVVKPIAGLTQLVVSNENSCAVTAASVEVHLFTNLSPDVKPIATKSRRFSEGDRGFIEESIEKLLADGVIRPSSSPWRAQVLVVKDETDRHKKRLCVDYSQTINIYTELDAYPLPRIDDMVNELAKYSVFSTFDLRSACHQIKIADSESKYTAFGANGKLYEFTRIPFGVKNGVAAFQRRIAQFIEDEKLMDTYAYLDNFTAAGRNHEEHDYNVNAFLAAIRRNHSTLNENKTIAAQSHIQVLSYVVGNDIVKPDPDRLSTLKEFPAPQCRKLLCRVVGMFAYYAKWIERFAHKVRPLATASEFPISSNALRAFESLKPELGKVAHNSVDETVPFVVECDASDVDVSAVLNQRGRPVSFMSRTLHGSELHYPACEKEASAIMEDIKKWSIYF